LGALTSRRQAISAASAMRSEDTIILANKGDHSPHLHPLPHWGERSSFFVAPSP
jgi:hypothetical protein